ncbi:mechanosensitive ion channel [Pelistega sp. NLN82]|uniref:Small-conductance mechanosensitive channel n=1 Tax=Pelistega ratti TaxID=2652177 RepID=A0A6L9Y3Z4_9BURK|nr:mechanosensitive ion channel domain-containing protein [Pelistega ratti]NEN75023.1 mechanosensitive ion channel [Pelistega ratti]
MDWTVFWTKYSSLLIDFTINFVSALFVLMIGWFIANMLGKSIRVMASRSSKIDPTAIPMFVAIVVWVIRVLVILVVLSQFGIKTTSLIAALGAAGVAIGLALQGTLQNIATGIMLIALRPIRAGDSVTISGITGNVAEIGLFLTTIIQNDGITVTMPNSTVWGSTITNFSRNATRRLDVLVPVSYGDDLNKAIAVLEQMVMEHASVNKTPEPSVYVSEYRDSVVVITVRVWTQSNLYSSLQADLMKQARLCLESHQFRLPLPQQIAKSETK